MKTPDPNLSPTHPPTPDDVELAEALEKYVLAKEQGRAPSPEALLARHPQIADRLRACLSGLESVEPLAEQIEPTHEALAPPKRLGDFEIVGELGRGGMGIVYRARQVSLKRPVALKVLPMNWGWTPSARRRFHREALAAARLHHSNIVAVYADGEEQGTCYYAMELIEGRSLDRLIAELRCGEAASAENCGDETVSLAGLSSTEHDDEPQARSPESSDPSSVGRSSRARFDTIARWVASIAEALEYAHTQGVIHRDVKPSNLMLGDDGRVRLTDFGLARVAAEPGMTVSGEMLGTPRYMSPEQVAAGRMQVDGRTDIYSLGATLFELLTLKPPFPGKSRDQIISQIISREPRRPRQIDRHIPVDLETICLKSLDKDPGRRYQTAGQLADDLNRYLNRFAIAAKRTGPVRRFAKWVRRRPVVAALCGCVLLAAVLAMSFAWKAHVSERDRIEAEGRHADELQTERRTNAIDGALAAAMSGDFEGAKAAIAEAELYGASTGWVRMLEGQVALHQGEASEAMEHLQQAVKLMPESIAANAMLGIAYAHIGQWEQAVAHYGSVKSVTPRTPEDLLFKGHLESFVEPARALETLSRAIEMRDSSMARLIRAWIGHQHAIETGDPEVAEGAVADAAVARSMLPENAFAVGISVGAHTSAANAYRQANREDDARRHFELAEPFAAQLTSSQTPAMLIAVGYYYDQKGDEQAALEQWRRVSESGNGRAVRNYATGLYCDGQYPEALSAYDLAANGGSGTSIDVERVFVFAEFDLNTAHAQYQKLVERCAADELPFYPTILYASTARFLGDNDEATRLGQQLRGRIKLMPGKEPWTSRLLDYHVGALAADELLDAASGSNRHQCEAHFHIGLYELAAGNSANAQRQFRAAVDSGVYEDFEYRMCRAFLRRMEQDPNWPAWISPRD